MASPRRVQEQLEHVLTTLQKAMEAAQCDMVVMRRRLVHLHSHDSGEQGSDNLL